MTGRTCSGSQGPAKGRALAREPGFLPPRAFAGCPLDKAGLQDEGENRSSQGFDTLASPLC